VFKSKFAIFAAIGVILAVILASCTTIAATTTTTGTTSSGTSFFDTYGIFIFIIVLFGLMYLLMIRPQRKRQKEQQKMMEDLKRGDQVMTTSGIYATIETVEEGSFLLKIESGALMRVAKAAVAGKRPENQM
jgi:preprotein translocase subunit YajC